MEPESPSKGSLDRRMIGHRTSLLFAIAFGAAAVAGASPSTRSVDAPPPIAQADKKPAQAGKTGIQWKVAPNHVLIFLDGKKLGEAGDTKFTDTKPGKHAVRLTKGQDETEMEVNVKKGEVLSFEFEFTDG